MRISDWSSDVCSSDLLEAADRQDEEGISLFVLLKGLLTGRQLRPLRGGQRPLAPFGVEASKNVDGVEQSRIEAAGRSHQVAVIGSRLPPPCACAGVPRPSCLRTSSSRSKCASAAAARDSCTRSASVRPPSCLATQAGLSNFTLRS